MSEEDLRRRIKHLIGVLVILPAKQKKRVLKSLPFLAFAQLEKLVSTLERALAKQKALFRKGFKKDPLFVDKFAAFQKTQFQRMCAEAANLKSRGFMKDYLNFKAEWRKK